MIENLNKERRLVGISAVVICFCLMICTLYYAMIKQTTIYYAIFSITVLTFIFSLWINIPRKKNE